MKQGLRRRVAWWRVLMFAPLVSLTTGCDSFKTPVLDPKRAYLIAPGGKHELELAVDTNDKYYTGIDRRLVLLGDGDGVHVRFGFLRKQSLIVRPSREVGEIEFDAAAAYYRFNGSEKTPLKITVSRKQNEKYPPVFYVLYEIPEPLKHYSVGPLTGGTMTESEVRMIEEGEDDLHHFHIPFSAAAGKYAVDIAFKVKIRKEPDLFGAPGMP